MRQYNADFVKFHEQVSVRTLRAAKFNHFRKGREMRSKIMFTILVLALGLVVWLSGVSEAVPMMGTAFTYQGRLIDANGPADGLYDFEFKLWMDPCEIVYPPQVGDTLTMNDLDVIDGYFTVELDFNSPFAFNGYARWLEIGVRPGEQSDPCEYTILSPRQEVTPTPYALQTRGIFVDGSSNVGIGTTNPLQKLHVADAGMASLVVHETDNDVVGQLQADTEYVSLHSAFNHPLRFKINDITRMFIDTNGKVGIGTSGPGAKLEIIQNIWTDILKVGLLTSPNRLILSSGNVWASISGGTTNRDDIVIQHSTGNVGIGETNPSEKLDVDGNIDVSNNRVKNYRGFPRPDYDSGWVPIDGEEVITLTHGLGGNLDNYVVDLQFKAAVALGIHCIWYGGIVSSTTTNGAYYSGLDTNKVDIKRLGSDAYCDEMRIRIWVYN